MAKISGNAGRAMAVVPTVGLAPGQLTKKQAQDEINILDGQGLNILQGMDRASGMEEKWDIRNTKIEYRIEQRGNGFSPRTIIRSKDGSRELANLNTAGALRFIREVAPDSIEGLIRRIARVRNAPIGTVTIGQGG